MTAVDEPFAPVAAKAFADKYRAAASEKSLAQSFWRDFFTEVALIADLMVTGIEFEVPVRSARTGAINFIDVLFPGVVLVEHKSRGKNLDAAEQQARDYLVSLPANKRAPILFVSDFARIRIVDVLRNSTIDINLEDLPQNIHRFRYVLKGGIQDATRIEVSADAQAIELMAKLYAAFEKAGYSGHSVSVFLVRLLFLNFGDDSNMWKRVGHGLFASLVADTPESGQGLGGLIQEVFEVLDTPQGDPRRASLSGGLADLPHVNGPLFKERLPTITFNAEMREALIATTQYEWSSISPAIFGSLFQTVKSKVDRRTLGEHYTSEANIMKVIKPLVLDRLYARLESGWNNPSALRELRRDLGRGHYLDPACGSGNFLVVTYTRLRELELRVAIRLQELGDVAMQPGLAGLGADAVAVKLSQFHGIEYEEWSSQIAQVAMFLADHQANLQMTSILGGSTNRFPLTDSADIHHADALETDWADVCPMDDNTIILGNPPWLGARLRSAKQTAQTVALWGAKEGGSELDYVANWFLVAASHLRTAKGGRAAFVATNSITQGEQPAHIWGKLMPLGMSIDFAHRTFSWDNGAPGQAAVHAVIIGFSGAASSRRLHLWDYPDVKGQPVLSAASHINGYLVDAADIYVRSRKTALVAGTARMDFGSMPNDGGWLSNIDATEADVIRSTDPIAARYLRRLIGATELVQGKVRYCLWLTDATPADINKSAVLSDRIARVRDHRLASPRLATKKLASTPGEFGEIRQPTRSYIAVPRHTSSDRDYVPMAIYPPEVITNDAVLVVDDGSLVTFGWLMSKPFNVWNKAVSGRIKNDTRVSATLTYNTFPFPKMTAAHELTISAAANQVLQVRDSFPTSSLADLYGPNSMPPALRKAHTQLDRATLSLLSLRSNSTDERILAELFARYDSAVAGLLSPQPKHDKSTR